jgi:HD-GYP domain-containing protein (c-di-GMP phosphodiesterase class II)/beta-phosphoglucomutase-like phosphatase (HAD superfamily)
VRAGDLDALAEALRAQGRAFLLPFRPAVNLLNAVSGGKAAVPPKQNPYRKEFRRALKVLKDAYGLVVPAERLHLIRGPPALKPHWTPDGHYMLPERSVEAWRRAGMDVVKALVQAVLHEEHERLDAAGAAAGGEKVDRAKLKELHARAARYFDHAPLKTARVVDLSELPDGPHFESRTDGGEFVNAAEAREVAEALRGLLADGFSPGDVVITSPYGAQLSLIRRTLERRGLPVPELKYLSRFPADDGHKIVLISAVRSTADALEGLRHMTKKHLVRWRYHAAKTRHPDKPDLVFRLDHPIRVWQSRRGDYYIRARVWNRPRENDDESFSNPPLRTLRLDRFALMEGLEVLKGRAGWKKLTEEELAELSAPYKIDPAHFAGLRNALNAGPRPILIGSVPTLLSDPEVARTLAPLSDPYEPPPGKKRLEGVLERVREAKKRGATPVAVFDLDDTLFDTRPRILAVLRDYAASAVLPAEVRDDLLALTENDAPRWSAAAALLKDRFGLDDAAVRELERRYRSPDYLFADRPLPGAARFLQAVHAAGAQIVFLSGRPDSPDMRALTVAALKRIGAPNPEEDARVSLRLRDPASGDDPAGFAFKAAQFGPIAELGEVVAAFDDLLPNVEALRARFPAAAVFRVLKPGTVSDDPSQGTIAGDFRLHRSLPFPSGPPLADAGLAELLPPGDLAGAVLAFHNVVPDSHLTRIALARGPPEGAATLDDLARANASGAVFLPEELLAEWRRRDLDLRSLAFIVLLQKDYVHRRYRGAVDAGAKPSAEDVARWRAEAAERGFSLDAAAALISFPVLVHLHRAQGSLRVNLPDDESAHGLLAELAAHHPYSAGHSGRVGAYAARIGRTLGYSEEQVRFLKLAGLLHDIGKLAVPRELLDGTDPNLAPEVLDRLRSHAKAGWDILKKRFPDSQIRLATLHHRRFDGGGYPDLAGLGLRTDLKGHDLPAVAEIVAAADAFDAQVSKRSYNTTVSEEEAVRRMRQNTGHFDPLFLDALEKSIEKPAEPKPAFSFELPRLRWDAEVFAKALAGAHEELAAKAVVRVDEVTAKLPAPLEGGRRVVAIGDIHGELQGLLVDLIAAGLVDERGYWAGGAAVFLQIGDIIDYGPHSVDTYLYLRGLQEQARAAGGDVVLLLGNHELMLLQGDWSKVVENRDLKSRQRDYADYTALGKDVLGAIHSGHIQAAYEAGGHVFVHSGVKRMFTATLERPADFVAHVNRRLVSAASVNNFVNDHAFFGDLGIFWVEVEDMERAGVPFHVVAGHKSTGTGRIKTMQDGRVVRIDIDHVHGARGFLVLENGERRAYSVEPERGRGHSAFFAEPAALAALLGGMGWEELALAVLAGGFYAAYRALRRAAAPVGAADARRLRYLEAGELEAEAGRLLARAAEGPAAKSAADAVDLLGLAHALDSALESDAGRAGGDLAELLGRFYKEGFEVIPPLERDALEKLDPRSAGSRGSDAGALSGARLAALFAGRGASRKAALTPADARRLDAAYRRGWLRGRWLREGRRVLDAAGAEEALRSARTDAPARQTVPAFDVSGLVSSAAPTARHAGLLRALESELRRETSGPAALVAERGTERAVRDAVIARLPEGVRAAARARLVVLTGGKARSWLDGLLDPDRVVRSLEGRLGRPVRTEIYTDDAGRWKSDWRAEAKALLIEILNDAEFRVFRSLGDLERDLRTAELLKIQA